MNGGGSARICHSLIHRILAHNQSTVAYIGGQYTSFYLLCPLGAYGGEKNAVFPFLGDHKNDPNLNQHMWKVQKRLLVEMLMGDEKHEGAQDRLTSS